MRFYFYSKNIIRCGKTWKILQNDLVVTSQIIHVTRTTGGSVRCKIYGKKYLLFYAKIWFLNTDNRKRRTYNFSIPLCFERKTWFDQNILRKSDRSLRRRPRGKWYQILRKHITNKWRGHYGTHCKCSTRGWHRVRGRPPPRASCIIAVVSPLVRASVAVNCKLNFCFVSHFSFTFAVVR